jgi:hypothetical protein
MMKDIDADAVEQRGDSAAGKSEEWRNDYNKMVGEKAKRRLATMITINNKLMEKATQELKSTLHEIGNGTGRPPSRRREDDLPEAPLHRVGQQIDTHHAGMPGGEKPPEVMHGAGGAADPAGDGPEPAPSGGGGDRSRMAFDDYVNSIPTCTLGKDVKRMVNITEKALQEPEKLKWHYSSTGITPKFPGVSGAPGGRREKAGENAQRGTLSEMLEAGQEVLPAGMWDEAQKSFYVHRSLTDNDFILWVHSFDLSAKSRVIRGLARKDHRMQKPTHEEKSEVKFSLLDYGVSQSWVDNRYRKAEHLRTKLFGGRIPDHVAEKRLAMALNGLLKNARGFIEQKKIAQL